MRAPYFHGFIPLSVLFALSNSENFNHFINIGIFKVMPLIEHKTLENSHLIAIPILLYLLLYNH